MKVVTPYRPFAPESAAHRRLGSFDWVDAARMLGASVRRSCGCDTVVITDHDTSLPIPAHHYATTERRLMLWLLEIAAAYLRSDDFDRDTAFICPDALVFQELRHFFVADLGIVVRLDEKYRAKPLLNSVQFWRHSAKQRLAPFYERALEIARGLCDDWQRWGADTEPLRRELEPFHYGLIQRHSLRVRCWSQTQVLSFPSEAMLLTAALGKRVAPPSAPIVDFKYGRKKGMRAYFNTMMGAAA